LNPRLGRLQTYPFQKLNALLEGAKPTPALNLIPLYIGEPKHRRPSSSSARSPRISPARELPATPARRAARSDRAWLESATADRRSTRHAGDPGARHARGAFAIAQTVVDTTRPDPVVVCPNPFYQIYEGAALLAGAHPST
jgi:N-succinyldiaminopimelate aminotransferase